MKYLGIDYGARKFGIAISDELGMFAAPKETLHVKSLDEALMKIQLLCQAEKIEEIILGLPGGFQGVDSPQTLKVKAFATQLKTTTKLPVIFWDETYSTKQAESGARGRKRENSDSEAARIILQEFLDNNSENLIN
ncbi:MAG: Holliday junction resolvase RuvX [bacterium]